MKFIVCLLALVTVAQGKPIVTDVDQSHSLADTAKYLQSIAHMSVVDTLTPLHVALSTLESTWTDYIIIASEHEISIPELTIPKIDVKSIMTCKPKSSPKYSMVLKYITDHPDRIQDHITNAKKLVEGLKFVSEVIINMQHIDPDTMITVSQKISEYLTDYASTILAIKSMVCQDETPSSSSTPSSHPMIESDMETPLSVYLKGTMPTGGGVDRGFNLNGGGVGKGFSLNGGGVGKGFDLNGGGVGKGFDLNGGGVGKGFSLNGGGVGKGFDLNGGGVGKGFNLNGGGVGKGFDLNGGGVGKGFDLNGGGVGRGFNLNGGGVGKGFDLTGGGVGRGFDLNGGGVGKGFDLTGGGVGRGFDLNGGGVGKGFALGGGGVGKNFDLGGGGVGKGFDLTGGGVGRGFNLNGGGVDK